MGEGGVKSRIVLVGPAGLFTSPVCETRRDTFSAIFALQNLVTFQSKTNIKTPLLQDRRIGTRRAPTGSWRRDLWTSADAPLGHRGGIYGFTVSKQCEHTRHRHAHLLSAQTSTGGHGEGGVFRQRTRLKGWNHFPGWNRGVLSPPRASEIRRSRGSELGPSARVGGLSRG